MNVIQLEHIGPVGDDHITEPLMPPGPPSPAWEEIYTVPGREAVT